MHGALHTLLDTVVHKLKGPIMSAIPNLKAFQRSASKILGKFLLSSATSAVTII